MHEDDYVLGQKMKIKWRKTNKKKMGMGQGDIWNEEAIKPT